MTLTAAIAARPRLLLVDGLVDQIEPETLPTVLDTLFAADAPWTLVVVSHNQQVLARCGRVLTVRPDHSATPGGTGQ